MPGSTSSARVASTGGSRRFGSGYRLFAVYGQGFTLLVGLVKVLSLGTIDTVRAVAIIGSLSVAAIPPCLASLSRSLGSTRRRAAIHGTLGLCVSFGFGGGVAGVYSQGLLPHAVAIPLLLVTTSALVRSARTSRTRPLALGALGVAGLVLVHPISVIVLVTLLPGLLLGAGRTDVRTWARPALALAWSAAVAAFWAVPAFVHRDLRGGLSGWEDVPLAERVAEIARGEAILPQLVAIAAAAALASFAGRAIREPSARRCLVAPAWATGVLLVGFVADAGEWPPHEAWAQIPNRSLAVVAYLLLLPLAAVLEEVLDRIPAMRVAPLGPTVAAIAAAAFLLPLLLAGPIDPPQEAPLASPDLQATAATVREQTAGSSRHLFVPPSPFLPLGTSEAPRWLAVASGRPTAQLYFPEATASPGAGLLAGSAIEATAPGRSLGALRRSGIAVVVVTAPLPAGVLAGQLGYRRIAQHGLLEVWAVEPDGDGPGPSALLQPAEDAITGIDPAWRWSSPTPSTNAWRGGRAPSSPARRWRRSPTTRRGRSTSTASPPGPRCRTRGCCASSFPPANTTSRPASPTTATTRSASPPPCSR